MPRLRIALLSLLLAGMPLAHAQTQTYQLDPVHTRVMFAVSHAGFSNALGTVSGSTGTLQFDPQHWADAGLQVSIPIARFDLGDAKWNHAVGAGSLLDVQGHPTATFESTRITPVDASHAHVCGNLQLRGVTHEICLDVTLHQLKRHPLPPFRRTAGFSATGMLDRTDFGITAWPGVIGKQVELRIEAEAIRGGRADSPVDAAVDAPPPGETPPEQPAQTPDVPQP